MRKTFGLCFLAFLLTAGTAHAQGLFLEKGQPGISATAGAAWMRGTGWSTSVVPTYTYRGVFDVGLDLSGYGYTDGSDENHLGAIGVMPFANAYFLRSEDGPLPVSVSGTIGVQKRFFMGNGNAPNPDGWGLLIGGSVFRRIAFSNMFSGIPEVFAAFDMQAITWHSRTLDAGSATRGQGEGTHYDPRARVLVRANMSFQAEKMLYTISPYLGYQFGLAVGANLGAIF